MSQYQAGTLVVYGNLGVHEIEAVGPQSFCGEPAREYYTLRPYFSDSHDRSYIPTAKEGVLRPVSTPEQAAACLEQVRSEPDAAPASANQTVLAEHYQAVIHTNDFYEYLKLYRELAHKQSTQRSKGRKVNAMDAYFYQMAERTLREELAVAFHETPEAAARRLEAAVSWIQTIAKGEASLSGPPGRGASPFLFLLCVRLPADIHPAPVGRPFAVLGVL